MSPVLEMTSSSACWSVCQECASQYHLPDCWNGVYVQQVIRQFTESQCAITVDLLSHSEQNPVREVFNANKDNGKESELLITNRSEAQEQVHDGLHISITGDTLSMTSRMRRPSIIKRVQTIIHAHIDVIVRHRNRECTHQSRRTSILQMQLLFFSTG